MKSSISTLAITAVVAIASLSAAHAQTQASPVNVPFAFECAGVSFAPGSYTVSKLYGQHMITLRDKLSSHIFLTSSADGPKNGKPGYLVFRKYGNRYFLAEYHPAYSMDSVDFPESSKERRIAKDFALNRTEPGRVQLALNEVDWIR